MKASDFCKDRVGRMDKDRANKTPVSTCVDIAAQDTKHVIRFGIILKTNNETHHSDQANEFNLNL